MDHVLRATEKKHPMTGTVVDVLEDRVVVQLQNRKQVYLERKDQDMTDLYNRLRPEGIVIVMCTGKRDRTTYGRLLG